MVHAARSQRVGRIVPDRLQSMMHDAVSLVFGESSEAGRRVGVG